MQGRTEFTGLHFGQVVGQAGGVARRQAHGIDVFRTQSIDRQRQHQGRIDAAGQAEPDLAEAVLAAIVADPAHDGAPGQGLGASIGLFAPQVALELARTDVVIGNEPMILERLRGGMEPAIAVGEIGGAVEHDFILPADDVQVGETDAGFANTLRQQRIALFEFAAFVGGGVRHHGKARAGRDRA